MTVQSKGNKIEGLETLLLGIGMFAFGLVGWALGFTFG